MRYNILDFGTVRSKVVSNQQRIITINKSKRAILRMSATLPIPEIIYSIIFDYLNVVMDRTLALSKTQEKQNFDISALINLAAKIEHVCANVTSSSNSKGTLQQQRGFDVDFDKGQNQNTERSNIGKASAVICAGIELIVESVRSLKTKL
jgi:hypothetical protein